MHLVNQWRGYSDMAIPIMNFPVFNPVKSGMETGQQMYKTINEGISQQLQNQMMREGMPYIAQEREAGLQKTQSEIQRERAQAELAAIQAQLAGVSIPLKELESQKELMKRKKYYDKGIFDPKVMEQMEMMDFINQAEQQALGAQQQGYGQRQVAGSENVPVISTPQGNIPINAIPPEVLQQAIQSGAISQEDIIDPSVTSQIPVAMGGRYGQPSQQMQPPVPGYRSDAWSQYLPQEKTKYDLARENIRESALYTTQSPAAQKGTEKRAQINAENQAKAEEDLSNRAQSANVDLQDLQSMRKMWNEIPSFEKGHPLSKYSKLSSKAQLFDKSLARLINSATERAGGAGISNKMLSNLEDSLPSRRLRDESFDKISRFVEQVIERDLEKYDFYRNSFDRGANKSETDSAWMKYLRDNPISVPDISEEPKKSFKGSERYIQRNTPIESQEAGSTFLGIPRKQRDYSDLSVNDENVLYTAQKYNMTPEQVIEKIMSGRGG